VAKHYATYEERLEGQSLELMRELLQKWYAENEGMDEPVTPIMRDWAKAIARRRWNDPGWGLTLAQHLVEVGRLRRAGDVGWYPIEHGKGGEGGTGGAQGTG